MLLNPELSEPSEQELGYVEGCLSIPEVSAEVVRPEYITVKSETLDGDRIDIRCGGLLARCLQHEVDHLHGKLFIDYLSPAELDEYQEELDTLKAKHSD